MKRIFFSMLFILSFLFLTSDVKASASVKYAKEELTMSQLNNFLQEFKQRIEEDENTKNITIDDKNFVIYFYDGRYGLAMTNTKRYLREYEAYVGGPVWLELKAMPNQSGTYYSYGATIKKSNGTFSLEFRSAADPGNSPGTVYSIYLTMQDTFLVYTEHTINWSKKDLGVDSSWSVDTLNFEFWNVNRYKEEPTHNPLVVPVPKDFQSKYYIPKGISWFTKKPEYQLSWTPSDINYLVQIDIGYAYYNSFGERTSKRMVYVPVSQGIKSSNAKYDLSHEDVKQTILQATGKTKYGEEAWLEYIYIRYQKGALYGNWVRVNPTEVGSDVAKGDYLSSYNEVYQDSETKIETVVTEDTQYNNIIKDADGKVYEPNQVKSMNDYVLAIPGLLSSLISVLVTLVTDTANFGSVIASIFVFLPKNVTMCITALFGIVLVVGIIKLFK